jgi:exodeoxyribonuclease VII small subunit
VKPPELSATEQPSFDQALAQLQQVVKTLESGELSLEDSLKAFERGVVLSRMCQQQLAVAEQKIEILVRGGEGSTEPELAPFQQGADETRKTKA